MRRTVAIAAAALALGTCLAATLRPSSAAAGRPNVILVAGNAAAIDGQGRIVVAGTVDARGGSTFELARYRPDGRLDASFGSDGRIGGALSPGEGARAVAIDSRGRIVVAGGGPVVGRGFAFIVARYLPDGKPDPSFGSGGRVTTTFESGYGEASANALAIDPSGRIVVAGYDCPDAGESHCADVFAVARYQPDGRLDRSFGRGGKTTIFICCSNALYGGNSVANSVAIDDSGRIVLAGQTSLNTSGDGFALARLSASGALDPTFGSDGRVLTNFSGATGVALDGSGRIVAAGNDNLGDFALAAYHPDGSPDSAFGSGGQVTTGFGTNTSFANAVAIDGSGRIDAAGLAGADFALARYTPSGTLDPSFGSGGRVTTSFGAMAVANDVAVDASGRTLATGTTGTTGPSVPWGSGFALARYRPDGELDPTFGSGGQVTTKSFPPNAAISGAKVNSKARTATFSFRATGPSRHLRCALRRGRAQPTFQVCTSPKAYRRLRPGHYTFAVKGVRSLARDRNPATRRFTLFARPNTKITKTEVNSVRGEARFAFTGTGKSTRLACKLTRQASHRRARFDRCRSPKTYRRLRPGRYTSAVGAEGPAGRDLSPAQQRFRIAAH